MLKPVAALIRPTALLTVAFLLAACSTPEIEQSSGPFGPDIKRDCARLMALQGKPDDQMASRRRDLALTILQREDLASEGAKGNNLAYAFKFCRAYLGLPPVRLIRVPQKGQSLQIQDI